MSKSRVQPPKLKSSTVRDMALRAFALYNLTSYASLVKGAISYTKRHCNSKAHNSKVTSPAVHSTVRTDRLLTPQLSDELLDPKFQVAVSRQTAPENETEALAQLEVVRMKDSRGREFNCYLPAPADGTVDGDGKEVRLPLQGWAPISLNDGAGTLSCRVEPQHDLGETVWRVYSPMQLKSSHTNPHTAAG